MVKSPIELYIVEIIKSKRKIKKVNQQEISEVLKVSVGYIGQVESKKSKSMYTYRQLNKLAIYLNCSPKDFMPDEGMEE